MKKIIVALALLFVPLVASASIDANLYYGIHNKPSVLELQEFLIDKGYMAAPATGNFYSLTLGAVKRYQASVGVIQSGYVGTLTRASINKELADNLAGSDDQAIADTGKVPQVFSNGTIDANGNLVPNPAQQQTTLDQINQKLQRIADNTVPPAPPAPVAPAPASKKDLLIENLTSGDVVLSSPYHDTFRFKVTVIDGDGNVVSQPYPITVSYENQTHYFGYSVASVSPDNYDGHGGCTVAFPALHEGGITLTFAYAPLGISKTVSVNVLAPAN